MKRKQVALVLKILEFIQNETRKLTIMPKIVLDIRDENRNTILHHAFSIVQDDSLRT